MPAYWDPSADPDDWATLTSTASQVPLIAIMNPNSGPGSGPDTQYSDAIDAINTAGGSVVGYVHTSYGARPTADVESEIDDYFAWYNVQGIFFDEMANDATSAHLSYYEEIATYVRSNHPGSTIIANPGASFDEAFETNAVADIFVDEEDVQTNVHAATQAPWEAGYPASTFAEMSLQTTGDVAEIAWLVANRHAGWFYATTLDYSPNPYSALPSDFAESVSSL
ncbi:MAG: spherulation-specific family 4 protein [Deltaproteobacteria bacterium]|nr:spherulation-specific family 4 protein [Deltaproteobacteria bacterium]